MVAFIECGTRLRAELRSSKQPSSANLKFLIDQDWAAYLKLAYNKASEELLAEDQAPESGSTNVADTLSLRRYVMQEGSPPNDSVRSGSSQNRSLIHLPLNAKSRC